MDLARGQSLIDIEVHNMGDRQRDHGGVNRFDQVDATGEADEHLAYLDRVEAIPSVVARWRRSYEQLTLRPGMTVAEIGCGAGTAARELATIVGAEGRVLGFDISEQLIAHARTRAAAAGKQIDFRVADAATLPLPDASLDGYGSPDAYIIREHAGTAPCP